jgi:uroporphyrinogen decarboxylase
MALANKRDIMMELLDRNVPHDYIPAAFFLHFNQKFRLGEPAVRKHLDFFRATGMDFVKIQYERTFPPLPSIKKPEDWKEVPHYKLDFYEPELQVVRGLIKAAKKEALILVTLYSPFMCAGQTAGMQQLSAHLMDDPENVAKGLETITDSLMLFVKECIRLGVDGFYTSTKGGEAGRFEKPDTFAKYIKPFDVILMREVNNSCAFNILHVCDFSGPYADLSSYLDYPGQVVNCNPKLTTKTLSWQEIERMFNRPVMGGLDRHGIVTTGKLEEIRRTAAAVLRDAPRPFILGADCTLPDDTDWVSIRAAVESAHTFNQ